MLFLVSIEPLELYFEAQHSLSKLIWHVLLRTAADPGFSQGAPTPRGRQHMILPNFPENCMKSKEIGCLGGGGGGEGVRAPCATPKSATVGDL